MRVLIVANHNPGYFSPFVLEQVESLKRLGVEFDFYGVEGKGIKGYLSNLGSLKKKIREYRPNLIHAHYGLSGLLANLQRMVPVVTTYHGSDIHSGGKNLFFSRAAIILSKQNIFVSKKLLSLSRYFGKNVSIIPCGIDTTTFQPKDKGEARKELGWDETRKYTLFGGSFDREVKNPKLALDSLALLENKYEQYKNNVELLELKNYTRPQVATLLSAVDCVLLTSHREGSPQIVKEALACGCPLVSVDVGDVTDVIKGVDGYVIASPSTPESVASALNDILERNTRTEGRKRIEDLSLSCEQIAQRIMKVYDAALR